jgi:FkbM family methyltransferase
MKTTSFVYQTLVKLYRRLPFQRAACHVLRALPVGHEKFYRDLSFRGTFTVPVGRRRLRLTHFGSTIENEIFWNGLYGSWEASSLRLWSELARRSRVIMDVGANTGIYSLLAAIVNPEADVYAFEPARRIFTKLQHNIAQNGLTRVHLFECAASDHDGTAVLYDFDTDLPYSASLNPDMFDASVERTRVSVPTRRLAAVVDNEKLHALDLIKIDVEKHEPEVLRGLGRDVLLRFRPTILLEVLTDELGEEVERTIGDLGYLFFNVDEARGPQRTAALRCGRHPNFLLCQESVARALGLDPSGRLESEV